MGVAQTEAGVGVGGEFYFKNLVHSLSVLGNSESCGCAGNLATQASVVIPSQRQAGFEMVYLEEALSIKAVYRQGEAHSR